MAWPKSGGERRQRRRASPARSAEHSLLSKCEPSLLAARRDRCGERHTLPSVSVWVQRQNVTVTRCGRAWHLCTRGVRSLIYIKSARPDPPVAPGAEARGRRRHPAPDTGALRGVPSRASASSSAMSSSIATPTAAAPAEVPEYIDA